MRAAESPADLRRRLASEIGRTAPDWSTADPDKVLRSKLRLKQQKLFELEDQPAKQARATAAVGRGQ
jgi:hypothetical protein